jgi:hypothetical protein
VAAGQDDNCCHSVSEVPVAGNQWMLGFLRVIWDSIKAKEVVYCHSRLMKARES